MRVRGLLAVACVLATQPACDQMDEWRAGRGDAGRLSLSLEAPEMLDWGGTGTIRLVLQNQGGSETEGATIEVRLPAWLEFGSVEPAGTEVTLLTGAEGTRLSYRLTAPLEPGARREIVQRVRVPDDGAVGVQTAPATPRPAPDTAVGDTAAPVMPPPADRVIRARLISPRGDVIGAEVHAVLSFRGARDAPAASPAAGIISDNVIRDDRVGAVRLGMTADELRREIPGARDTTLVMPDGGQERAVLVPMGDDRAIAAIVGARGVEQIVVRDPGFSTERGLGVGTRLGELRAAYGQECAELLGGGRAAVTFATAPSIAFALSATAPADTARLRQLPSVLPDSARVTELRVRQQRVQC
jgi:hypothetical protein